MKKPPVEKSVDNHKIFEQYLIIFFSTGSSCIAEKRKYTIT